LWGRLPLNDRFSGVTIGIRARLIGLRGFLGG
jgi:hypothetical protein